MLQPQNCPNWEKICNVFVGKRYYGINLLPHFPLGSRYLTVYYHEFGNLKNFNIRLWVILQSVYLQFFFVLQNLLEAILNQASSGFLTAWLLCLIWASCVWQTGKMVESSVLKLTPKNLCERLSMRHLEEMYLQFHIYQVFHLYLLHFVVLSSILKNYFLS